MALARSQHAASSGSAVVPKSGASVTVQAGTLTLARSKAAQRYARAAAGVTQEEQADMLGVSPSLIKAQESDETRAVMNGSHLLAQPADIFDGYIRELCKAREEMYGEPERRLVTVTPECAAIEAQFANLMESQRHAAEQAATASAALGELAMLVGAAVSK